MMKSCKYCGRIHDSKYDCGQKPKRIGYKKGTDTDKFHSTNRWTELSKKIRRRDNYLCQACLNNLDGQGSRITIQDISVHHIIPVGEAWELRYDRANLISLCREHHEQAEAGTLSRAKLTTIAIKLDE